MLTLGIFYFFFTREVLVLSFLPQELCIFLNDAGNAHRAPSKQALVLRLLYFGPMIHIQPALWSFLSGVLAVLADRSITVHNFDPQII